MKFFKFKTSATWLATWFAVATMVSSPLAQAQEAKNISKQQIQAALDEMGLNKSMTVGEFLKKNRDTVPARILKDIEPVFNAYKNVMMPEFKVSTVKGNDGREIPTVTMSYNGQIYTMQWFGQEDKIVRIQNTNLISSDILNFDNMFAKLMAGDEVLRKQVYGNSTGTAKASPVFTGLPEINAVLWKKMTMEERVSYMIQIRKLWLSAQNVLIEKNKINKTKKTAANDTLEKIWTLFAGIEAEAAGTGKTKVAPAPAKTTPTAFAKPTVTSSALNGASCLVAGYSAQYNGSYCDHEKLLGDTYANSAFVQNMKNVCSQRSPGTIACNPLIYGTPDGGPICVPVSREKKSSFQTATHFGGFCDSASLLQRSPDKAVEFLKNKDKHVGRYDADNLSMTEEQRRQFFKEDQAKDDGKGAYAETKKFVEGILKVNDPSIKDLFDKGVLTDDVLKQLNGIQDQFNKEIRDGTNACKAAANDPKAHHETNFWGACDQMQRRFLFVADLLQTKCEKGTTINATTLKCTCADKSEVAPGASCKPAGETVVSVTPVDPNPPGKTKPPEAKSDDNCPAGQIQDGVITNDKGAETPKCIADPKGKDKDKGGKKAAEECGFLCSLVKVAKFVIPVAIVGFIGYKIYKKVFLTEKPGLTPAGDVCSAAGTACVAPCTVVTQVRINGVCGCAACPPGQSVASGDVSCQCVTPTAVVPTTTTTTYTCPSDSSITVTNLLNCPTTTTTTTTNKTSTGTSTGTGR